MVSQKMKYFFERYFFHWIKKILKHLCYQTTPRNSYCMLRKTKKNVLVVEPLVYRLKHHLDFVISLKVSLEDVRNSYYLIIHVIESLYL